LLAAGLTACGAASASTGTSTSGGGKDLKVVVVFTLFDGGTPGRSCNVGTWNVTLVDQSSSVLGQQTIRSLANGGQQPTNVATVQPYNGASSSVACTSSLDFGPIAKKSQYGVAITDIGSLEGATTSNTVFFSQADRDAGPLALTFSGQ
jgi:hypothetical protein